MKRSVIRGQPSRIPHRFAMLHPGYKKSIGLLAQCAHVEGRNGSVQTFEGELARRLEVGQCLDRGVHLSVHEDLAVARLCAQAGGDRKSTRLNSSHVEISY